MVDRGSVARRVVRCLTESCHRRSAARSLAEHDFCAQAVAHAYYASFFTAEGALLALGESRSKHSGVISAFGQLVLKGGGLDTTVGVVLRMLFELRSDAVYDALKVEKEMAPPRRIFGR